MRAEPMYSLTPGSFRRVAAPTQLSAPELISKPSCLLVSCLVVLLLVLIGVAASVEVGRMRHDFRSNANKHH